MLDDVFHQIKATSYFTGTRRVHVVDIHETFHEKKLKNEQEKNTDL